jgi:hypothetical protein
MAAFILCRDHAVTNGQRQAATDLTISRFPLSGMNPNTVGPPTPSQAVLLSMTGGMPRTEAACGKIRGSVRDSMGQMMLQQRHASERKIELLTAAVADASMRGLRSAGATVEMPSGSL